MYSRWLAKQFDKFLTHGSLHLCSGLHTFFCHTLPQAVHQPLAGTGANISTQKSLFQLIPQLIGNLVLFKAITHPTKKLSGAAQTVLEWIKTLLRCRGLTSALLSSNCILFLFLLRFLLRFLPKKSIEHVSIDSLCIIKKAKGTHAYLLPPCSKRTTNNTR